MEDRVKVIRDDALNFLRAIPDDSVDLIFTSPPYLDARTYGLPKDAQIFHHPEDWADWMTTIVGHCVRACRGLTAIVCEGRTENYAYQPAPAILESKLYSQGFNLRKAAAFYRYGIFGSGGPDWFRNDWEPVICVTRPGKLPWADPTICGEPPKYPPGGRVTHRTKSGERVSREYTPPELANPGNVIRCLVGGGHMGHDLASENEAPFPVRLPEVFIRTFCPPDGLVVDPFCGSSTTGHACLNSGRRYWGCDIRKSQVDLSKRRLETVTPMIPGCA